MAAEYEAELKQQEQEKVGSETLKPGFKDKMDVQEACEILNIQPR